MTKKELSITVDDLLRQFEDRKIDAWQLTERAYLLGIRQGYEQAERERKERKNDNR